MNSIVAALLAAPFVYVFGHFLGYTAANAASGWKTRGWRPVDLVPEWRWTNRG